MSLALHVVWLWGLVTTQMKVSNRRHGLCIRASRKNPEL